MISPKLFDEILAVCPTWDGIHRPRPPGEETDRERIARMQAEAEARDIAREGSLDRAAVTSIIITLLRDAPLSTFDLSLALHARRGWRAPRQAFMPAKLSNVLVGLARAHRIRAIKLTSKRDIARAGGEVLWEAA